MFPETIESKIIYNIEPIYCYDCKYYWCDKYSGLRCMHPSEHHTPRPLVDPRHICKGYISKEKLK